MRNRSRSESLIAAERRRLIVDMVKGQGFVNVTSLVSNLNVGEKTIRNDLDRLAEEGKVDRVHGGAVAKSTAVPRAPYTETRGANMCQKKSNSEGRSEVPTRSRSRVCWFRHYGE